MVGECGSFSEMEQLSEEDSEGNREGVGMAFWKGSVCQAERIVRANHADQTECDPFGELQMVKDGQCIECDVAGGWRPGEAR